MRAAPALAVARAEIELADEEAGAADPFLPSNPTLQASVGPRLGDNGSTDIDYQLSVQQPIEIAGQRPLRFDVARAARRTREANLGRVRWEVHQRVHAGYRSALVARRRAELAREIEHFQADLVDVTRQRVEAGEDSPLILRIAEAEAAQAAQRTIAAIQAYREACLSLAETTGWDPARPPVPVGSMEAPRDAPPLRRLLELARTHNPLLEVRRLAIDEARSRVSLTEREAWPNPSVGVQFSREGAPGGGSAEHILLGILSVPIPSFGLNQAERAGAQARLEVALSEQDALRSVLVARLERLRTAVDAATARMQAYGQDILPRFVENLLLIRRAFQLGEIDLLQVSVAVDRFLSIQLEALDANVDYAAAVAALEAEVGTELEEAR